MKKILVSGRVYDCADPGADPRLTLGEVGHSLAHLGRWGGACTEFFSDAEHSISMARDPRAVQRGPLFQLACLWHDADEIFFGDMTTEIKHRPEMAWYREAANLCRASLVHRFAPVLDGFAWADIKFLDRGSMLAERSWFPDTHDPKHWPFREGDRPISLYRAAPDHAKACWIRMHYQFLGAIGA